MSRLALVSGESWLEGSEASLGIVSRLGIGLPALGTWYLFQERSREEREVRLSKQEGARLWMVIIKVAVCDENVQDGCG